MIRDQDLIRQTGFSSRGGFLRYVHVPTGCSVGGFYPRGQSVHRHDRAIFRRLRGKLARLAEDQTRPAAARICDASGDLKPDVELRTYRMGRDSCVEDTRSGHRERDLDAVLGGEIDGFIRASVRMKSASERGKSA